MRRHLFVPAVALALVVAGTVLARPALAKWPPWLSIEAPVNPFDPDTRDAVLLVHTMVHDGTTKVSDLTGSAEGLVDGARRSVALRFDRTSEPGVYAVRRQWPSGGTWVLRITLLRNTTALVTLGQSGDVAAVNVPTRASSDGMKLPRAVAAREVDSTLYAAARRQ
ncbi:MAG TPA: hypothetical protein VIR34_09950 [Gemmatimonadaceae bacterium]